MANWYEPSESERSDWAEQIAACDAALRPKVEHILPWRLYRIEPSDQVVIVLAFLAPDASGRQSVTAHVAGAAGTPRRLPTGLDLRDYAADALEPYEPATPSEHASWISSVYAALYENRRALSAWRERRERRERSGAILETLSAWNEKLALDRRGAGHVH